MQVGLLGNMIVAEFLKRRLNMGRDPQPYFYRDASQKEVDLLEEVSYGAFDAYEIKLAGRYSDEFSKGLNYISKLYPGQCKERVVLFDDYLSDLTTFFTAHPCGRMMCRV